MISGEKENVTFNRVIDPAAARGNVEEWLLLIESVMYSTMRQATESTLKDYSKKSRTEWTVAGWPGMSTIAIDMLQWTVGAEEAMKKGGITSLEAFYQKLNDQMEGTVNLVRTNLTSL